MFKDKGQGEDELLEVKKDRVRAHLRIFICVTICFDKFKWLPKGNAAYLKLSSNLVWLSSSKYNGKEILK